MRILLLNRFYGRTNMRKLLISLLAVGGPSAFAQDYTQFQAFDNQISIGYGLQQQSTTAIGGGNNNVSTSNIVNLEGERLLNNGVWIDANANMVFGQGNTTQGSAPNTQIQQPVQSAYGFNGKVGYAFPLANQHLLITPYGTAGLNNNGIANTVSAPNGTDLTSTNTSTTTNQFYYTGGLGGRIEYRINHAIELYADQAATYNWDQTSYNGGIAPQNYYLYTSTLGAKFNIVKDFQLGVKGFYQNYQMDATSGNNSGLAYAQPQTGVGGLVSLGLTY